MSTDDLAISLPFSKAEIAAELLRRKRATEGLIEFTEFTFPVTARPTTTARLPTTWNGSSRANASA